MKHKRFIKVGMELIDLRTGEQLTIRSIVVTQDGMTMLRFVDDTGDGSEHDYTSISYPLLKEHLRMGLIDWYDDYLDYGPYGRNSEEFYAEMEAIPEIDFEEDWPNTSLPKIEVFKAHPDEEAF